MKSFRLTISSPDGNCFDGDAVFLSLRGSEGDLAVMAGHIPFISGGLLTVSEEKTTLLSGSFSW